MHERASQADTKGSRDNLTVPKRFADASASTGREREVDRVNYLDVDLAVGVLKHWAVCAAPARGIADSRAGPALVAQVARVAGWVEAQLQGNIATIGHSCCNLPQLPCSAQIFRRMGTR